MRSFLRPLAATCAMAVLFGSNFLAVGQTQNGFQAQQQGRGQQIRQPITQRQNPQNQGKARGHQTVAIRPPKGFPLTAAHENHVNELLNYWERSSAQIERLRCNFTRWKYDSTVCNYVDKQRNSMLAHEIASGLIQFGKPDKALVAVEKKDIVYPPDAQNPQPRRVPYKGKHPNEHKEKWICNGKEILYYDYFKKQIVKSVLPPEMQGQGLKNSPLPFFFGAKAAELKSRYWIRTRTPKGAVKQWWLELYPKRRQDAEFYQKAVIILEGDSFLPKSIHMYKPAHNPQKVQLADGSIRPAIIQYDIYEFQNRQPNFREGIVKLWNNSFNPRLDYGWRMVDKKLGTPQPGNLRNAQRPNGGRKN